MKPNQLHPTTHVQAQCRPYLFLLFALLCMLPLWADQPEDIKKKEITKSFKTGKDDQLQVDNRYGHIHVTYWKKNEVEIRIVIEAKTKSEATAQEWIDRVKIQMDKTGNTISAVTSLRNSNKNFSGSFSINYFVQMPERLTCELEQMYGNIYLPDENKGKCTLRAKYGNIEGGNFSAPLYLESKYGNVTLGNVDEATLDVAYCGKVNIGDVSLLHIDSSYSNFYLGNIRKAEVDAKYGNIQMKRLEEGTLDVKYTNCRIEALQKRLSVPTLSYGNFEIEALATNFERIDVNARYGNLNIGVASDASFQLEANNMRYGRCSVSGIEVERRHPAEKEQLGFDNRADRREKDNYFLDINGGKRGKILFEGNNYSNIKVTAH